MVQVLGEGRENRKGSIGEKGKQRYERGAKDGEGGRESTICVQGQEARWAGQGGWYEVGGKVEVGY